MSEDRLDAARKQPGTWRSEDYSGRELATGSCWPVDESTVITNYHVISGGPRGVVTFGRQIELPVVGIVAADAPRDIAAARIKMGRRRFKVLPMAKDLPRPGTTVYVIGSPQGLRNTITRGIVSAVREADELVSLGFTAARRGDRFLQIDASIGPGSSGGPIVDEYGRVLAVTCFTVTGGQSLNFGIPVDHVRALLQREHAPKVLDEFYEAPVTTQPRRDTHAAAIQVAASEIAAPRPDEFFEKRPMLAIAVVLRAFAICDGHLGDAELEEIVEHADEMAMHTEFTRSELTAIAEDAWDLLHESMERDRFCDVTFGAMIALRRTTSPSLRAQLADTIVNIVHADGFTEDVEVDLWNALTDFWDDLG